MAFNKINRVYEEELLSIEIDVKKAEELIKEICYELGEENCYRAIEINIDVKNDYIVSIFAKTKDNIALDFGIERSLAELCISDFEKYRV